VLRVLVRWCGGACACVIRAGTFPSEDEWEVTTPISIVEWFYNFYQETDKPGKKKAKVPRLPFGLTLHFFFCGRP
jgi:hypothetical protein